MMTVKEFQEAVFKYEGIQIVIHLPEEQDGCADYECRALSTNMTLREARTFLQKFLPQPDGKLTEIAFFIPSWPHGICRTIGELRNQMKVCAIFKYYN